MALTIRTTRRAARGFTLIELLLATALFAMLSLLMFRIASDAAEVWNDGERNRVLNQRADAAFALLSDDLRHTWAGVPGAAEQGARFVVLPRREELGDDERPRPRVSDGLAFTRLLHEQREAAWLRRAGDRAGAEGTTSLLGEPDADLLRPTAGLAETLVFTTLLPGDGLPSLMRVVRTPIGGARPLTDPDEWTRLDRLLPDALPIADDVLFFGVECWRPGADAWSADEYEPPAETSDDAAPPEPLFAARRWDSTRALAPGLPGHVGEDSLWDGRDDAFPSLVRLTLAFGAGLLSGRLGESMGVDDRRLVVDEVRFLRDDEERAEYVLVDHEWMRLLDAGVGSREFVVERGARGTVAAPHDEGATVRVGRTFRRVVSLPAARPRVDG